jgi:hypothetical protein
MHLKLRKSATPVDLLFGLGIAGCVVVGWLANTKQHCGRHGVGALLCRKTEF